MNAIAARIVAAVTVAALSATLLRCTTPATPCRSIGGKRDDAATAIVRAHYPTNGYVVAGWTESFQDAENPIRHGLVVRTTPHGTPDLAVMTAGISEEVRSMVTAGDVFYATTGWILSNHATNPPQMPDAFLVKLDTGLHRRLGLVYHLDPDSPHAAHSVAKVSDIRGGGYAIAGWALAGETRPVLVLRLDDFGAVLWAKSYGIGDADWHDGFSITEVYDKDASNVWFAVAGRYASLSDTTNGGAFVLRLDGVGDPLGASVLDGANDDVAVSVLFDSTKVSRGIVVAGHTRSYGVNPPYSDIWAAKLRASDGGVQWSNVYYYAADTPNRDELLLGDRALVRTSLTGLGNGYAISGATYTCGEGTPTYPNFLTMRLDIDGSLLWGGHATIHPSSPVQNRRDLAYAMTEAEGIPNAPNSPDGLGYAVVGVSNSIPHGSDHNMHFVTLNSEGRRVVCTQQEPMTSSGLIWQNVGAVCATCQTTTTECSVLPCKPSSMAQCQQ
jgi:hypothetical protein